MPLPSEAFTVTGGCNCGAIRYRISVPELSSRPLHPNSNPALFSPSDARSKLEPVRLPYTFTDHCNDCRRATGSILPTWITADINTVEAASLKAGASVKEWRANKEGDTDHMGPYRPGRDIFTGRGGVGVFPPPSPANHDPETQVTVLKFYESTPGIMRGSCSFCCTNVSYWCASNPGRMDFTYGTLDRDCLEQEGMRPERHMWWGRGIGWVKSWIEKADPKGERHLEEGVGEGGLEERIVPEP